MSNSAASVSTPHHPLVDKTSSPGALKTQLIALATTYRDRTGISLGTIGTRIVNDGNFFVRLQAGGDCTTATWEKAMAWLAENMPPDPARSWRVRAQAWITDALRRITFGGAL